MRRTGAFLVSLLVLLGVSGTTLPAGAAGDGGPIDPPEDPPGPPTAWISPTAMTVPEGNGNHVLTFTVSLSSEATSAVTVNAQTEDGTAAQIFDYMGMSLGITFSPGQTTKTVSVTVYGDGTPEPDETFTVRLLDASGAVLGTSTSTVTLTNDDGAFVPAVTITSGSVAEGNEPKSASLSAKLSGPSTSEVRVDFAVTGNSATAGVDFMATSGEIVFNPGETSKPVDITVMGDTAYEPNESVLFTLGNARGATLGIPSSATLMLVNDDAQPPPTATLGDVGAVEQGSGTPTYANVPVTLSAAAPTTTTISYETVAVTTTSGTDHVGLYNARVDIQAGSTTSALPVQIYGDNLVEGDETFLVRVISAPGLTFADDTATVTITDDDIAVLSAVGPRKYEGASGKVTTSVKITIAAPAAVDQHFPYHTVDGTAVAGSDYVAKSGTLTIPAGATTAYVPVTLIGDTRIERDETFHVALGGSTNTLSTLAQATVTLANDDWPKISLGVASITEPDTGVALAKVPVRLSAAAPWDTKVTFTTGNGTASAGSDYKARTVTVTIPAGRTKVSVSVAVVGDRVREADEYFYARLTNALRARWGTRSAKVTVRNDD